MLLNCPCGYGKDIKDDQTHCPICSIDLSPLRRLRSLPGEYQRLGTQSAAAGDAHAAVQNLITAVSLDPFNLLAYQELTDLLAAQERYQEAIAYTRRSMELTGDGEYHQMACSRVGEWQKRLDEQCQYVQDISAQNDLLSQTLIDQEALYKERLERNDTVWQKRVDEQEHVLRERQEHIKQLEEKTTGFMNRIRRFKTGLVVLPVTALLIGWLALPHLGKMGPAAPAQDASLLVAAVQNNLGQMPDLEGLNLTVKINDGRLVVTGEVPDAVYQSLIGEVVRNTAPGQPADIQVNIRPAVPAMQASDTLSHTVKPGDNLYKIAHQYYGNDAMWLMIYAANQEALSDPDIIAVDQVLRIPAWHLTKQGI